MVTLRQKGTMIIRGVTFTDNLFRNVTIVKQNDDGTYQVQGIVPTPASYEITVPADWIEA
jgi:hypothetical protein